MAAGRCCAWCALRKKPRAQGVLRTSITDASNSAQTSHFLQIRLAIAQRMLPAFLGCIVVIKSARMCRPDESVSTCFSGASADAYAHRQSVPSYTSALRELPARTPRRLPVTTRSAPCLS